MSNKYLFLLFLNVLIIKIFFLSCKRNENNISENKKNEYQTAKLSIKSSKDLDFDKINKETFSLKGIYHNCEGASDGQEWKLAKVLSESTLRLKKNDTNCILKIIGFEYLTGENLEYIENYSVSNIVDLLRDFNHESIEFIGKNNIKIYSKFRINSNEFSSNPIVSIILSDAKNINSNDVYFDEEESIEFGEIFDLNESNFVVQRVKSPEYRVSLKNMKILVDANTNKALYSGKIKLKKYGQSAKRYIIVPDGFDTSSYKNILNEFNNQGSKMIYTLDPHADEWDIEVPVFAKLGAFPVELELNTEKKYTAKIILENKEEFSSLNSDLSSYQIIEINIKRSLK